MQWIKSTIRFSRRFFLNICALLYSTPIKETGSAIIIAPHPDDEVFGCGGFISKWTKSNKKIEILFLSKGDASHKGCCDVLINQVGAHRKELAERAAGFLGVSHQQLHFLEGKDGRLPHKGRNTFIDMTAQLTAVIKRAAPEMVFCPHPFEGWPDHIAAMELTVAAINILPAESRPKLYYYCVWFWFSMPLRKAFQLNWKKALLLDISKQLPLKREAMNIYLDSFAPCGNPWVGKLPKEFLRAFDWDKELFFEADSVPHLSYKEQ